MWLFTKYGFFSVTVDPYQPERMQIRARAKADLENLAAFAAEAAQVTLSDIAEFPQADYRYRMFCSPQDWIRLAEALAADVDYSNFKNQIKTHHRHQLYQQVWNLMRTLHD